MKIVLLQSELAWGNVSENLRRFDSKLAGCGGADLILLPEMFASGCMMVKKSREVAGAEKEAVASRYEEVRSCMLQWANRCDAAVLGSTVCREEGRYYNRLIAAFPDGTCEYYDKRHCFRMGGEQEHFSPGANHCSFQFRGGRIAVFICYDLRFPVWSRNTEGYDVAVYVANWPESRREVWQMLLRARAIENQAFVAGVNCVGTDNNGIRYAGDSMVVDARGNILGDSHEFQEEILVVDCDIATLHDFRRKFSVLDDRDCFSLEV